MNLILNRDIHMLIAEFIPDQLCWHCLAFTLEGHRCCFDYRFLYEGCYQHDLEDARLTVCVFCLFENKQYTPRHPQCICYQVKKIARNLNID